MFVEIKHKIGDQNRVSLLNTDKIIAFDPCFVLKYDEIDICNHLEKDEIEKLPDNPLISDFPERVIKIVKYNVECGNCCYEILPEEYERLKKIMGVLI